jgi:hypothetical protein
MLQGAGKCVPREPAMSELQHIKQGLLSLEGKLRERVLQPSEQNRS